LETIVKEYLLKKEFLFLVDTTKKKPTGQRSVLEEPSL